MEYESKRSLVQEEVELMEGKVDISDVREDRREIQSAEDNTEHISLRQNHHASVVFPCLKSSLSLTEACPPQKLQFANKMDSKNEAKTKNSNKGGTLSPDDQLVEAPESLLLVNHKEQSLSSDKVLVQPPSFVTSREIPVRRKDVTQTVSDKMNEMSSPSVSSEQQWTGLFSPITAAAPQKEKPRNNIHEDILLLERSALLTSAKDSCIDEESCVSFLGNKKLGALFKGMSDVPTSVLPQTKVLPPVEGHQSRRPSAMRPADKKGPAEAQATRHENNPDMEKAEKLQKGICFS